MNILKFSLYCDILSHINNWALTYTYTACWIYSFYRYSYYIDLTVNLPRTNEVGIVYKVDLFSQLSLLLIHNYYKRIIPKTTSIPFLINGSLTTKSYLSKSPDEIATTYPYMWIYMINIIFINLHYIVKMGTQLNIIGILVQYTVSESSIDTSIILVSIVCKKLVLFICSLLIHFISIYMYITYIIDLKLYSHRHYYTSDNHDIILQIELGESPFPSISFIPHNSCVLENGTISGHGHLLYNSYSTHFIIVILLGAPLLIDQYITTYNIITLEPRIFTSLLNHHDIGDELFKQDGHLMLVNINILAFYLFAVIALFKSTQKWTHLFYGILFIQNVFLTNISVPK